MSSRIARLVILILAAVLPQQGAVTLPKLISGHIVLQRDIPVRIWGKAAAGESVIVSFRDQIVATAADEQGHWEADLTPLAAGGAVPHGPMVERPDAGVGEHEGEPGTGGRGTKDGSSSSAYPR